MATPVPGTILTNPNQTQDIGSYYVSVTAVRNLGYEQATPQMRARGLLNDMGTSEEAYAIPMGPISIGNTVIFKDGDRPGAGKPQLTKVSGLCQKRGITPLRLFEADRMANRIPITTPNIMARGRSERLMEDEQYSRALEAGTDAAKQASYDGKAYFATDHYFDPVAQTGAQSNLLTKLPLTPDNLGKAKTTVRKWKAENGQPLFAGFVPEWLLEVPPNLEKTAQKICTRDHVAEGGASVENIEMGTRYFVNSFLTNDTTWFLHIINAMMPTCYRVVFRPMVRRDKDASSELFKDTGAIEIFADEWTDYRLFCWPLALMAQAS